MPMFVLLTRLSPDALRSPRALEHLEREVVNRIRQECPAVEWLSNLAILGPHDYLDIFTAPDVETAAKVAMLVRVFGHAETETWAAVEWDSYKTLLRGISGGEVIEADT